MKISITIDVDAKASGYANDDELRDNIMNCTGDPDRQHSFII
ncbi:hypothetical protein Osc1_24040 [Hominimerdicola sp. 21CYCFAH17_S]